MFVLQANDVFETREYLKSWDYENGECIGFSYTDKLGEAKSYTTLQGAWEDLRDHGFGMCFMIVEVDGG